MKVLGMEKMYGATIVAERLFDGEEIFGFAIIPVDEDRSYLINCFDTEGNTADDKGYVHYNCVTNSSINYINNSIPLYVEDEDFECNIEDIHKELVETPYGALYKEYSGEDVSSGEVVKGFAAFTLSNNRTIILKDFEPDRFSDNRPGFSSYAFVKTESLQMRELDDGKELKLSF